jgi:hypothetical protein
MRAPHPGGGGPSAGIIPGGLCLALCALDGGAQPAAPAAGARGADGAAAVAFVGLEGGQLLRCRVEDSDDPSHREFARALSAGEAPRLAGARDAGFERHGGAATGVAVSPFQVRRVVP